MKYFLSILLVIATISVGNAQNWTLKDMGVGLIIEDEKYDQALRIVERKKIWDVKALYEGGALAGKYGGNQLFAAWIVGPHTREFLNRSGVPVWSWKYRLTYPDGKTFEAGPQGFYTPGFSYVGIKPGSYTRGNWKIDFYIWNRDTKETRHIGATAFQTTYGTQATEADGGWKLKDIGVGIYDETQYDKVLNVVKRGDVWSQKELYEKGFFSGRDKKVFGTWIEGPPAQTFLNNNGVPVWLCKFTITYPSGTRQDFGPYNFQPPGFYALFINASGHVFGEWKIDYYLWHRDSKENRYLGTKKFTLNP